MVLHVISSLGRGGKERQLVNILNYSDDKAVVFKKISYSYDEEYNISEKLIFLKTRSPFLRLLEIYKIIKQENPDLLWSWGNIESTFCFLLSFFTSVKHINGSIRHGIVLFKKEHLWRKIILHLSRHIVANSKSGLKVNGLKKGYVLYNGLDEKFFKPVEDNQLLILGSEIRMELLNNKIKLISIANLVPYKDYITVLKALEILKKNRFKFVYLIVGEGPNRKTLELEIQKRHLDKEVYLLGRRKNIAELLSISDLFIHSSKGEGCSNAILEAMAAGLPIVATSTGGTPEIVDETYGRLFEYQNFEQLYEHLLWFINNPDEMKKMGFKARQVALERFSVRRMIEEYEKIVQQIVRNK